MKSFKYHSTRLFKICPLFYSILNSNYRYKIFISRFFPEVSISFYKNWICFPGNWYSYNKYIFINLDIKGFIYLNNNRVYYDKKEILLEFEKLIH